jgi:hypothetical protein
MNRYKLILCELHHPFIHGKMDNSDPYIETHFIVISEYNIIDIQQWIGMYTRLYKCYTRRSIFDDNSHPTIYNFAKIVANKNYIKHEIAECIILPTGETIAILKTFWIRIIQKVWRKILRQREQYITSMQLYKNLYKRELGKIKFRLPGIKGMLNDLFIKNKINL